MDAEPSDFEGMLDMYVEACMDTLPSKFAWALACEDCGSQTSILAAGPEGGVLKLCAGCGRNFGRLL